MFICDVKFDTKNDQIFQNSSQEPSTSSKYDCVIDALIIMLGNCKFKYNSKLTNYVDSWCKLWYQRRSNPPKLHSGTINVLQVWLCSWCTFNHARKLKIGMQHNNDIWWLFVMSNLIPKMTNYRLPPGMTVFLTHICSC